MTCYSTTNYSNFLFFPISSPPAPPHDRHTDWRDSAASSERRPKKPAAPKGRGKDKAAGKGKKRPNTVWYKHIVSATQSLVDAVAPREGICDARRQQMLREMHILDIAFEVGQLPLADTTSTSKSRCKKKPALTLPRSTSRTSSSRRPSSGC